MVGKRWMTPDFVITVGFLLLFVWVIYEARSFPYRAALFPVLTASVMVALVVLKLVQDFRRRPAPTPVAPGPQIIEEDVAAEAELEDIFETAPRSVWLGALAWLAAFFVLLWVLGMYITVPLFALVYLLVVSRDPPWLAGAYALASWLFVYGLFDQLLHIPLPAGALLGAIGL
jgi:hypothetical protein